MSKINHYEIIQRLNSNPEIEIYRAYDPKINKNIILKNINTLNEFQTSVVNLKNEFEIMKYLSDSDLMLKVYSFERHTQGYFLSMEDTEGTSLKDTLKNENISIEQFFNIALDLSDLLLHIHKKKVIHKDIKPDNIILDKNLKKIHIIDFGISTRLSKEETKWAAPNVLEGSIYYISPEQTGRMNRAVDYRSDFYSLGITFYEILTGKLPFMSSDLLELVHSHLAKTPVPAFELNPDIPVVLSKIIDKLMSKTAENRYQTALGLKQDLENCKNLFLDKKKHNLDAVNISFELGERDISDEFIIQQKLYGRDADINSLIKSFQTVKETGKSEIILIAGYSGVGKSSLVKEISKPITESRGYFINGKYDQFNKNMPFSALIQVFTNIVRLILTETPEEILKWKEELLSALGNNGKILTDVIPDLEYIIGVQPSVIELGAQENANRFYLVFQNFLKVLSNETHPLAIFLDDLQWADSASLGLLQSVIEDETIRYLFLMLAYRDNEIDKTHPFQNLIDEISKINYKIEKILLKPLNESSVKQILKDSLHSNRDEVDEIASLVMSKTGGNPFFINEFLKKLYRSELIYFNYDKAVWEWKIDEIRNVKVSENVVGLLIDKISILSPSTQDILKYASCIGNIFDLSTLSQILKKSLKETANELKTAIDSEMIFPIGDTYKLVESMLDVKENSENNLNTAKNILYKFQHDRVQQASYEIIDQNLKTSLRLEIARILLKHADLNKKEEALFDIVNHYNTGFALVTDTEEIKLVIHLNLQAGRKAKVSTAYKPALEYLSMAYNTLIQWKGEENSWKENYNLTLNISKELAEVQYLNGIFENSESTIQKILLHANTLLDKSEAYNLLMIQYSAMGKFNLATETIRKALKPLDVILPEDNFQSYINQDIENINEYLTGKKISSLLNLPLMNDPLQIIKVKLLMNTYVTAYNTIPDLASIISLKLVYLYLKYGNLSEAWGYSSYSIYLTTALNKYREAYEFSLLSMEVSKKYGDLAGQAKAANILANYANPWIKPIKESEAINKSGIQSALDSGEFLHGSYSALHYVVNSFYQGKLLKQIFEEYTTYLQFSTRAKNNMAIDTIHGVSIIISNLLGNSSRLTEFKNGELSEDEFLKMCTDHQSLYPVGIYKTIKAQVLYYYGMYEEALEVIKEVESILPFFAGINSVAEFTFYYSLILCSLYKKANKTTREEYLQKIHSNQKQMKTWAESCSENFLHKFLLVEAEIASLEYKNWKAGKLYDEAIAEARKNEFIQNEALGNELAGRFYLKKKNYRSAQSYLIFSLQRYEAWGIVHKVNIIKNKFSEIISANKGVLESPSFSITNSINTTITAGANTLLHGGNSLDFQSIMKSSAAISGEIRLESLLQKIMNIVIENAGAQRGVLLLKSKHDFIIEAEGSTSDSEVKVRTNISLKNFHELPHSLIYYVERTKDHSVIHDAVHDEKFNKDEYIQRKQIKSILCSPILKQGVLSGVLYIENNLTTGAFTEDRLQVIKVLATQAAISIDNALLYANLEERVMERTRELKQANEELADKNKHITDSIHYAKTIQEAILPSPTSIGKRYDDFFIGFYPKDIVSGDFFWYAETPESTFIAAVDCTGHGVPGAFMSMIGTALLNQIVKELKITDPAGILTQLNKSVRIALKQDLSEDASRDGMEICLCRIDPHKVIFSGGHRPLFLVKNGEFHTYRGDKESIGGKQKHEERNFTNTEIHIDPKAHTAIYLTTDGFQDQPNPEGKKIGSRGLHEMIAKYHHLSGKEQAQKLEDELKAHSRTEPQRDDITIIGIIFQKR